jgi:hypothetical protein
VKVVTQAAHGPNRSRELAVVAAIVHLVLVKALRDTRHDVLSARERVDLREYRGHAIVAPVGVQQGLGVALVMAQDAALLAKQVFQLIQGGLVTGRPLPRRVKSSESVEFVSEDAVVGQEAAVIVAKA